MQKFDQGDDPMKCPQQAKPALSQHSNSAPFSRRQRSLLSKALCSAGLLGAIAAVPSAYAVQMRGLTIPIGPQQILSFDSATPGTVLASPDIAPLGAGEIVVTIDYRPADGVLYGVTNFGNVVTINPTTGAALEVRNNTGLDIAGLGFFGLDFNPTNNRLRLTSNLAPTNRAIDVEDATLAGVTTNTDLIYAT
ncbi:MAG: DUF4394 domain-containing protein, partial [Burkholderiales bacterium]|nr:DUF4394 domain-containing protein [Burkholderiales bacterium]